MSQYRSITKELVDFIMASPSCYHVIDNVKSIMLSEGAIELREDNIWQLEPGNRYFVVRADSSLIAFYIPKEEAGNFQIIASHSDSPSFKIKENAEIFRDEHYVEMNVEMYGGALCAPWFDRPLSIAGRVVVEEDGVLKTKLINFDRDLVMMPSLAIHMNRSANDNASYKIQSDMLPLFGDGASRGRFEQLIAEKLNVKKEQILDKDLFLYNRSRPSHWGANREFFSCTKLDDLMCAFSSMKAFLNSQNEQSISLCCIFDNEEVGSRTKNGAGSTFMSDVLNRISHALGFTREKHRMLISSGFMVSADNAHAIHPNHVGKADPTNHPHMNEGVVVKYNARQKYTTDAITGAIFRSICKRANIPTQVYVNHSDVAGGSTLGNIANMQVSINTVDIGAAQLAMHSPYETAGIKDTYYLNKAMEAFYNTYIYRNENGDYVLDQA